MFSLSSPPLSTLDLSLVSGSHDLPPPPSSLGPSDQPSPSATPTSEPFTCSHVLLLISPSSRLSGCPSRVRPTFHAPPHNVRRPQPVLAPEDHGHRILHAQPRATTISGVLLCSRSACGRVRATSGNHQHRLLWVSETEKASIEERLEEWTERLMASGADIASFATCLKKPLRPLWISHKTVIWLNEVPHHDSWDFTLIILVSASSSTGISQHRTTFEFNQNYIPGAGDDEESWARGLSPSLFWNHVYDLINSGPDVCN